MFCSTCGNQHDEGVSFCRKCGTGLENSALMSAGREVLTGNNLPGRSTKTNSKDPDELTANGIGGVIVGDGFLMVAVFLSAIESSVSSLLWLFLLIPAFYYFGRGFAEVVHARQIRLREKARELNGGSGASALPPPRASVVDILKSSISGELTPTTSVIDKTTRDLQ